MPDEDVDNLVNAIHANTHGESQAATGAAASNLDLYQVNSTYYSALGCNDQHYIAARAVQFFLPGVPQVYYVGALAGKNDMELLRKTNNGRDINRHYYSTAEIDENLQRPVVKALNALAKFRNELDAFDGTFSYSADGDTSISFTWEGTTTQPRSRLSRAVVLVWRTPRPSPRSNGVMPPVSTARRSDRQSAGRGLIQPRLIRSLPDRA